MKNKKKKFSSSAESPKPIAEKKGFWIENNFIFLTVFIAMLIIIAVYVLLLYFPFGDNTILKVDLYHQYAPFHEELRSKLLSGSSLIYSWEGGLGKELISQIAYYTSSPFSLLMILFPQKGISEAMALFAMLKISLAGGFFSYYLKKAFNKNDITITIFGLFYSFMSFLTYYYWNIMWLDVVAVFPLVALGIEYIVNENKYILYTIALTISIFVNFYIAFIVCVFAVLYFLVVLFSKYSLKNNKKIVIEKCLLFALCSLLGGCMAMIFVLPSAIALSHTKASDSTFPSLKIYSNVYQILENNFLGARPVVLGRNEDLPNIYSGLFAVILLPCYFANKRFPFKEKLLYGALLIFIYACSCINVFDYMIHGMHFPANLPHRYGFIYSFLVICLAYKAFINIKDIKLKNIMTVCVAYTAILLISEYVIVPAIDDIERVFSDSLIIINILFFIGYYIFISYLKSVKNNKRNILNFILMALVIVECSTSSVVGLSDRMNWVKTDEAKLNDPQYDAEWTEKLLGGKYKGTTERSTYIKYMDGINDALKFIENNDKAENIFHRTELRRFKAINSASLHHYNGISQFSSLAYGSTSAAMQKIGVSATGNSYRYYDPTPLFNAIFNVKYILSADDEIKNPPYKYLGSFGADENNKDNIFLYENTQPLSLGFMVNSKIKDWDMDIGNPFEVQNQFAELALGKDFNHLKPLDVYDIEYDFIEITDEDKETGKFKYSLQKPYDLETRVPEVRAKVYNDKRQRVFLYIDAGNCKQVSYSHPDMNDKKNRDFSTGRGFLDCGIVPADCTIDISFKLNRKSEFEKTYKTSGDFRIFACTLDSEAFNEVYDLLNDETLIVDDYGDSYVHGKITALNDGIMFTSIPYDKGWNLIVDGEKKEFIPVGNDGFIGVELEKGEHEIYFKYHAKGLLIGAVVSVFAAVAFIVFARKNKIIKFIQSISSKIVSRQ